TACERSIRGGTDAGGEHGTTSARRDGHPGAGADRASTRRIRFGSGAARRRDATFLPIRPPEPGGDTLIVACASSAQACRAWGDTERDAQRGYELASSAGAPSDLRTEAMAICVASEIALTLGQIERARILAQEAGSLAERDGDEQIRAEAALSQGEVELAGDN